MNPIIKVARPHGIGIALLAGLGLFACGSGPAEPPPPPPPAASQSVQVASGDAQSATVATKLPAPLTVRLTDASGQPASGVSVTWRVSEASDSLSAASSITNAAGLASVDWTLGTRAGAHTVIASLSGSASSATFRATALAGPVATFERVSPSDQYGLTGLALGAPLAVKTSDRFRNATRGTVVTWTVTAGQGSLAEPSSVTDTVGVARTVWTLGSAAGTNALTAAIPGFGPLSFSAISFAPACPVSSEPVAVRNGRGVNYTYEYRGVKIRTANLYAPELGPNSSYCPMVVMLPGGCQNKEGIDWAGPLLAAHGYIVMTVSIQAAGAVADALLECATAARAALDFLASEANPYQIFGDGARIGAVGFSAGAEVVSGLQDSEMRLAAIVAWDNLVAYVSPPRVPALGIAAEVCTTFPQDCGYGGFSAWRNAGLPAMQVVLANTVHGSFGAGVVDDTKRFIAYYTWNWFDRWLKDDAAATTRLLANEIAPGFGGLPKARADVLSATAASKAFLDGQDCADLRNGCP